MVYGYWRRRGSISWGILHPKVPQFSHGGGQSSTNLSQAFGLSQLAEEHGHKMVPRAESLTVPLGTMVPDQMIELTLVE
jgi:hypothetical protein